MTDYSSRFRAANIQQLQQVCAVLCDELTSGCSIERIRRRVAAILTPDNRTWDQQYAEPRHTGSCCFGMLRPDGGCNQPWRHSGPCDADEKPLPAVKLDRVIRSGELVVGRRYRILEIADYDESPSHKVGDIVTCGIATGEIRPTDDSGHWYVGSAEAEGTFVTAVELVEDEAEPVDHSKRNSSGELGGKRGSPSITETDPTIIHAAEGVVLEPGEYEIVALASVHHRGKQPSAGERFTLLERLHTCYGGVHWWFVSEQRSVGVTAVRRVEPQAAQFDCEHCKDTHQMPLGEEGRLVMCTRCPRPCENCRGRMAGGGQTPYCASAPCPCGCHRKPQAPKQSSPAGSIDNFDPLERMRRDDLTRWLEAERARKGEKG